MRNIRSLGLNRQGPALVPREPLSEVGQSQALIPAPQSLACPRAGIPNRQLWVVMTRWRTPSKLHCQIRAV